MEKLPPGEEESKTAATAAAPRVSFVHEESKEERVMRLCNPTAAAAADDANRVLFYPHNLAPSSPCLSVCLSVSYATVSRERDLKRRGRNETQMRVGQVRSWRWSSCKRRVWQFGRRAFPRPPSSLVVSWADENCGSKTLPTSFEREDDWGCVFGLAYQAKDIIVFRFIIEYMVA